MLTEAELTLRKWAYVHGQIYRGADILKCIIHIYNCDVHFPTYNSMKCKKCDFLANNVVKC